MARFYVPKQRRFSPAIQLAFAAACFLGAAFFWSSFGTATIGQSPSHSVQILIKDVPDEPVDHLDFHEESLPDPFPSEIANPVASLCPDGVPTSDVANDSIDLERDCIVPDISAWKVEDSYTEADVYATADVLSSRPDVVALIRIESNQLFFEDRDDDCIDNCNVQLQHITMTLRQAMEEGSLHLPDCLFLLNVDDSAMCRHVEDPSFPVCTAPVLSINRRKDTFRDILVPEFASESTRHSVPWEQKQPIAFFRGAPYCNDVEHYIGGEGGRLVNCSRLILSELSRDHPDLLNVSITSDFDFNGRKWDAVEGPDMSTEDHAKFQMLLNLDGYAASTRLAKLLPIDSVVLKQESVFEEYYYRVLQKCVHYVPFWTQHEEDILEVVTGVLADPETAKAISANAQAFALTHLGKGARLRYWEMVLQEYFKLFTTFPPPTEDDTEMDEI